MGAGRVAWQWGQLIDWQWPPCRTRRGGARRAPCFLLGPLIRHSCPPQLQLGCPQQLVLFHSPASSSPRSCRPVSSQPLLLWSDYVHPLGRGLVVPSAPGLHWDWSQRSGHCLDTLGAEVHKGVSSTVITAIPGPAWGMEARGVNPGSRGEHQGERRRRGPDRGPGNASRAGHAGEGQAGDQQVPEERGSGGKA